MNILTKTALTVAILGTSFGALAAESSSLVEPGYVNYNYEMVSDELSIGDINRLQSTASGGSVIIEAGYVNYNFAVFGADNNAVADFNGESYKPFYNDFQ